MSWHREPPCSRTCEGKLLPRLPALEGKKWSFSFSGADGSWLKDTATGTVYLSDKATLWKMWLAGQAKGQSSLDAGGSHYSNARWGEEERERFEEYRKGREGEAVAGSAVEGGGVGGVGGAA